MPLPPVYTKLLLAVNLPFGGTAAATVPAGKIWVLTDVTFYVNNGGVNATFVSVSAALEVCILETQPPDWSGTMQWSGRIVLEAGEALGVNASGTFSTPDCTGRITGFELSAP